LRNKREKELTVFLNQYESETNGKKNPIEIEFFCYH